MFGSRKIVAAAFAATGLASSVAFAQEAPAPPPVNNGSVSLSIGTDVTTAYLFRGVIQEDQGLIVQPWAEVGFNLFSGDDALSSVDLTVGTWSSLHSEHTGSTGGNDIFYETDYYVGISATFMEKWAAGVTYYAYTSPNGAFSTVQEIDVYLGYDDTGLVAEGFALNPYTLVAFELDNSTAGPSEGIYWEVGMEPTFTVMDSENYPISLSVPVAVGFNIDDYYSDDLDFATDGEFFGYAKGGVTLSVPLSFIPAEFGAWKASLGADVYYLGQDTRDANGDSDQWEIVGRGGISMSY